MKREIDLPDTLAFALVFGLKYFWAGLRMSFVPIIFIGVGLYLWASFDPYMKQELGDVFWPATWGAEEVGDDAFPAGAAGEPDASPSDQISPEDEPSSGLGEPLWTTVVGLVLIFLVGAILLVPPCVRLLNMAAGTEEAPRGLLYFRWGRKETAYLVSVILWPLIIGAPVVLLFALGFAVPSGVMASEGVAVDVLVSVIVFASMVLGVWLYFRMILFTVFAAVEGEIGLFRSLKLTGGKFWIIVGISALFSTCVQIATYFVLLPAVMGIAIWAENASVDEDLMAADPMTMVWMIGVLALIYAVVIAFNHVASLGLSGRIYRRLALGPIDSEKSTPNDLPRNDKGPT